jgi:signal transduction histidine kinase
MDERDDVLKATNDLLKQDPSSSQPSNMQNNNESIEYEQTKQSLLTQITYGDETIPITDRFAINCKSTVAVYADKNAPSTMVNVPEITRMYEIFKRNSVKIRLVAEVDSDNIGYCKHMMKRYGVEIRHLAEAKGNFAISDDQEYIASAALHESEPIPLLIHSNVKEVVDQNQFVFEILWKKAIPIEQRIKEIEGRTLPIETYLIDDPQNGLKYSIDFVNRVEKGLSICTSIGHLKLLDRTKPLLQVYLELLSKQKKGIVKEGIRWLTYIDNNKKYVGLVKKFLSMGFEMRHSDHLPPLNFAISDKQFVGSLEKIVDRKMFEKILHSTEPLYMKHFQAIFEELWKEGMDAQERIRQIETGIAAETTKVIENPIQSKNLFLQILEEAQEEIMIIFPSLNSVKRQSKIGFFNLLKLKNQQNFRIRILSPMIDTIMEILLLEYSKERDNRIDNILVREIPRLQEIRSTILMVDKKQLLAIEVKDDTTETFEESIGLVTYSTSYPTVLSYTSIFETLWIQTEMFENVRISNEKLVESEELEREFINTAAHELRTPTQAIMGYTELDAEIIDDILKTAELSKDEKLERNVIQLHKHIDAVYRNSERLNELINNLLDVARIESNRLNSLQLRKEKLDLIKEINDLLKTELGQKIIDKNIKINVINDDIDEHCLVYADKLRINQIFNNLIGNAIKFTNQNGKIDIIIKENVSNINELDSGKNETIVDSLQSENKEKVKGNKPRGQIYVGVSDTGKGISPKIIPKLFEKFTTDSDTGTGLGLYITRNLVEAHGGKIWAFNNADGIGSTFVFTLPKTDDEILDSN